MGTMTMQNVDKALVMGTADVQLQTLLAQEENAKNNVSPRIKLEYNSITIVQI